MGVDFAVLNAVLSLKGLRVVDRCQRSIRFVSRHVMLARSSWYVDPCSQGNLTHSQAATGAIVGVRFLRPTLLETHSFWFTGSIVRDACRDCCRDRLLPAPRVEILPHSLASRRFLHRTEL